MSPFLTAPPPSAYPSPASVPLAATLDLPRILCLHGGGVNAEIFALQCRSMRNHLKDSFRLVFADGPHFCGPGPDIVPVYEAYEPYRRWLRWKVGEHPEIDNESATDEILYCVRRAMEEDEGDGPWVGVLGFSQGAKVAASLLYDTQCRLEETGKDEFNWKFAVVMQGRHPLVSFSEYTKHPALVNAGEVSEGFTAPCKLDRKLRMPTVHVHGLADVGLSLHRVMLEQYHESSSVTLVEWDGGHRLPLKTVDVEKVCQAIRHVARRQGIEC